MKPVKIFKSVGGEIVEVPVVLERSVYVTQFVTKPVSKVVTSYASKVVTSVVTKTLPSETVTTVTSKTVTSQTVTAVTSETTPAGGTVTQTVSGGEGKEYVSASELEMLKQAGSNISFGFEGDVSSVPLDQFVNIAKDLATQGMAILASLDVYVSEPTYDYLMATFKEGKASLTDPYATPEKKSKAIVMIMYAFEKVKDILKEYYGEKQKYVNVGHGHGYHSYLPTAETVTINISGEEVKVPRVIADRYKEWLSKIKAGELPEKSISQQVIYTIEKALSTAAFWPSELAEFAAGFFTSKAEEESDPLRKAFFEGLAVASRAGGGFSTTVYDMFLTALTGGYFGAVIGGAVVDQLGRSVTDPYQREVLAEAMKDPQVLTTVILPTVAGAVAGGAVSIKAIPKATSWIINNIDSSGKSGALARALFKFGTKTGLFKNMATFTDPSGAKIEVIQAKDGSLIIKSSEFGYLRFDSKVAPEFARLTEKVKAIVTKAGDYKPVELYKVFKAVARRGDPNLAKAVADILDDVSKLGKAEYVSKALNIIMNNIDDPARLTAVEYFVRVSGGKLGGDTTTLIDAIVNDKQYYALIKEAYSKAGRDGVYEVVKWISEKTPDKGTVSRIIQAYQVYGFDPSLVSPDEVLYVWNALGGNADDVARLGKVLDQLEKSVKQVRGAGKDYVVKSLKNLLEKYRVVREGESGKAVDEFLKSYVRKVLVKNGIRDVDDVLGKVFGESGLGVTAKVETNLETYLVEYGSNGLIEYKGLGKSVIDPKLLKDYMYKGVGYSTIKQYVLDDASQQALVGVLKKLYGGKASVVSEGLVITKDMAGKILKELQAAGYSGPLVKALERLAKSVSKNAVIRVGKLPGGGLGAVYLAPRGELPIVGKYVITKVVEVKLGDLLKPDIVKSLLNRAVQIANSKGVSLSDAIVSAGKESGSAEALKIAQELASKFKTMGLSDTYIIVNDLSKGTVAVLTGLTATGLGTTTLTKGETETVTEGGQAEVKIQNSEELDKVAEEVAQTGKAKQTSVEIMVGEGTRQTKKVKDITVVPVVFNKDLTLPYELEKEIIVPVTVPEYRGAEVNRPLTKQEIPIIKDVTLEREETREVVIPLIGEEYIPAEIDKDIGIIPIDITKDVIRTQQIEKEVVIPINAEYVGIEVDGTVIPYEIAKQILIEIPYYDIVWVPIENKNKVPPPPPPTPPTGPLLPIEIPRKGLPPPPYGKPPKRRRQREEVVL